MTTHNINLNGITFHHTGVIVSCIEEAIKIYSILFGAEKISKVYLINDQKVKVCFVEVGNKCHIELVEPLADNLPLNKLIKKGVSYYHTAYRVNRLEDIINSLEPMGYKFLNSFESEAFSMKRCVFAYSPDLHLSEFIEN